MATAITTIMSSSGTITGGTIHSARRNCRKEMLPSFAAGAYAALSHRWMPREMR